jgi:hypothetical protein
MAMVDASLIFDAVVAVSIAAGALFAVLELRGIAKDRRAHTVMELYTSFISSDMTEAYTRVMTGESQNPGDMEKRCSYASLARIAGFYEGVGYLCRKQLVDPKVVMDLLPIVVIWQRMRPWLLFDRARTAPTQWMEFEYLGTATEAWDYKGSYLADVRADIDALNGPEKKGI